MSTRNKFYTLLLSGLIATSASAQPIMEMTTRFFVGTPALGPTTNAIGPIAFERDINNNNQYSNPTPAQSLSATFSLANQTFTGLPYSNISTGLVFGGSPTTAVDASFPATQRVDPNDTYNLLGSFSAAVGGPTNNMFTSSPGGPITVQSGTGVIADGIFSNPANGANGAVGVFTAAQVLFDRPGGPAPSGTTNRYYYGDLVITFSRYVKDPVIHVAGMGGSYRYFPVSGTNINDPAQWLSTYFSTELEAAPGFTLTRMSGNQFFSVSGNNVLNTATAPNGASVNTVGGLFQDLGAASGSFRVNGTMNSVVLRVYLRGSNASQFPWSTVQANVNGANRNPFTGDIWWVSATAGVDQLITLPATGLNLTAALNGNDALLNWKTLSEASSHHFDIERSTDGVNFTAFANKSAAGSSATPLNYSLTDMNVTANVTYYRVKLVDYDGKATYSNVAMVRKGKGAGRGFSVFPNPATSQINLEFTNAKGTYIVSLFNQAGQEVQKQKVAIGYNVQYTTISRNGLAAGSYTVRARKEDSNEIFVEKVVLQ